MTRFSQIPVDSALISIIRPVSGTEQLRDEIACVDLGHYEKRFNRPIELTTYAARVSLLVRQRQAMIWVRGNPTATVNRARSYRRLFEHAALPSVPEFVPQLRVVC